MSKTLRLSSTEAREYEKQNMYIDNKLRYEVEK